MKITVVGGTGRVGSQLVSRLRASGHLVVPASPATGVNSVTGQGLAEAFDSAHVVVDVTNPPFFDAERLMSFFATSAHNLVAESIHAGVGHLAMLSVVGVDRSLDSAYFQAKSVQEATLRSGGTPCTVLRSTQFYEFAESIAQSATDGNLVRLPPALVQPIASSDVAAVLADLTVESPVRGVVEIAGPERMPLAEFVGRVLTARGDPRVVVEDANALYFGARLSDASLTPVRGSRTGAVRLDDWLLQTVAG